MVARARRAASTAWPAASGYDTNHSKVFTVSTQGARRTCLTWSRAPTRSEEGGRQRGWSSSVAPMVGEVGHASGSCSEVIGCSGHASGSCSKVVGEVGHASGSCFEVIGENWLRHRELLREVRFDVIVKKATRLIGPHKTRYVVSTQLKVCHRGQKGAVLN
jgi:hypothetical protein